MPDGRHLVSVFVCSLVIVTGLAGAARAQGGGAVAGVVADETGGVLPGVIVDLDAGDSVLTAVSDAAGAYRIDGAPAGPATLTFRLVNFSTARQEVTVPAAGETLAVDATLTLSLTADVVVTGTRTFRNIADLENPRENLVGIATAASVGAITAAQLEARPIMRPGEVLEAVPGLIVSQHSGEGKANQYYLRGFNLDHGSDFATTLAGVPLNVPAAAHFHGYSDSNLIIPELVSGVQYKKGPYFAEDGDFSAAGSANINYVNALDRPIVNVSAGGQGWARVMGAVSPQVGDGNLLVALDLSHNDGPWVLPDDLRKANGIVRYSRGDTRNGFSITGMGYTADWNATDQVPVRAIESGLISRFGAIDPTDVGRTYRHSVAFDWLRSTGDSSLRVTAYGLRYGLNLVQNFTYFLANPIDGDQFEQEDRRTAAGGKVSYRRAGPLSGPSGRVAGGRAAPPRQRRPHRPVRHGGAAAHERGAGGRAGADVGRPVRAERHRVEPGVQDHARAARRPVRLRRHRHRPAQLGRRLRRHRQPQGDRRARPLGRYGVLRQLGTRLPQQRRARRDADGRSPHGRARRHADAAGDRAGRRGGRADGAHPRPAVDGGAVVPGLRFGAAVHRRLRRHGSEPAEPALGRRVGPTTCASPPG